jgi:hypothetical protein
MSDTAPIPLAAFSDALEDLDRTEFAAFVGALRAESAADVAVEPPIVTVWHNDEELTLLVGADPSATDEDVDAVVTASGEAPAEGAHVRTITPADLRQELLYAVGPEAAERLATEYLGQPVRSDRYHSPTPAATASGPAAESGPDPEARESGAAEPVADGVAGADEPQPSPPSASGSAEPPSPSDSDRNGLVVFVERLGPRLTLAVVIALVVLSMATGAAVVSQVQDAGEAATGAEPATDADAANNSTGNGTTTPESVYGPGTLGDANRDYLNDSERDRAVTLAPTCDRTYVHVVQIQMNALKYNDNTTDDGIRVVRHFSSPANRDAVGSFADLARVIKSPGYSSMLSYDSAEFRPLRTSTDTATVTVVTRTNGTVTGSYDFYLSKQDGGRYDGCWMTNGVRPLSNS